MTARCQHACSCDYHFKVQAACARHVHDSFWYLQVFVANPNKTKPIIEILVGNKDKLLKYLTDFHSDKGEPKWCQYAS